LRSFADKHKISFFSGEENNVLQRFIAAADANDIDVVIRVCADNPFIQVDYINSLIEAFLKEEHDYISFFTKGNVPVIKTHYGFFTEMVKVKALKKIASLTTETFYLEHVTNFIYTHPGNFKIKELPFPFKEPDNKIRLTIDTKEDFRLASYLYSLYKDYKPEDLIKQVEKDPELLKVMAEQVIVNSK
jgi:spore coat polysaccharide biosynthesis protein SpsF